MNKSKTIPFSVILTTFFIAVFCDIKAINSYLVASSVTGPMAIMYLVSAMGAVIVGLFSSQNRGRKMPVSAVFILFWVILLYITTISFIGQPYTSLLFFIVMTLVAFTLSFVTQIDGKIFLRLSMLLTLPAITRLNDIFVFVNYSETISMGQSYAFLFPVVATIVYLFIYFRDDTMFWKLLTIVLAIVNGVYAYYLFFFGSRGPVLSIVSIVFFLLFFRHSDQGFGVRARKGKIAAVGIVVGIAMISFVAILSFLQDVLGDFGVSLHFIDKFLNLSENGDMSNGRQLLLELSFRDIAKNPLLGMGFDQFYNNYGRLLGVAYPHNFIIQILYDGGLLLLLVLVIPIWKGVKNVWKTCTIDEYAVIAALVFSSVPRALFTGDLWQSDTLWMLFGILLNKNFIISQQGNS